MHPPRSVRQAEEESVCCTSFVAGSTCITQCVLQRHPSGIPGGAVEELSGHAGANAGRKGLPGDWVPAGEG